MACFNANLAFICLLVYCRYENLAIGIVLLRNVLQVCIKVNMDKKEKDKKSIAIITHYHNSLNYGGCLQAYALSYFLTKCGYDVEQLCYDYSLETKKVNCTRTKKIFNKIKKIIKHPLMELIIYPRYKVERTKSDSLNKHKEAMRNFRNKIPHSVNVYNKETISNVEERYDIFITGSDQVWNFEWYHPAFFLDFVTQKPKISYAASMAVDSLNENQKILIKEHLKDFNAISVRENNALELLKDLTPILPIRVVDPVLLLDKEEWDNVSSERQIKDEYIFCYFLGNNKNERKIAKKFAKKKNLPIVTAIFSNNVLDFYFGAKRLYGVGPEDFISLIKHSQYVFTDSFHAVVFSYIYKRQYFVFNREQTGVMNSRIISITNLFNASKRFCVGAEREKLKYVLSVEDIDYSKVNQSLDEIKTQSIEFLKRNLEKL